MRAVSTRRNNAATQNFRDYLRGFAGTVHAIIGKLIGGKTLGMERAETGFVAENRPAGHGHTPREQNFDRRIQPQNRSARRAQKSGPARLRVVASAKRENGAF